MLFFECTEDLRDVAARIAAWRTRQARPVTEVEHILGQYIIAYQDMKAVLLGMDDRLALQAPAEGEWPLRTILLHILKAQRSFFAICSYALGRARLRDDKPPGMSVEERDVFWSGNSFENLKAGASIAKLWFTLPACTSGSWIGLPG